MKLVTLLTYTAMIYFVSGAGLLIGPMAVAGAYGLTVDQLPVILLQIMGATLFGFGSVNLAIRASDDLMARKAVTFGNLMFNGMAALVMLRPLFNGSVNAAGWSLFGVHTALALAFAYIIFVRRSYVEVRFDEW